MTRPTPRIPGRRSLHSPARHRCPTRCCTRCRAIDAAGHPALLVAIAGGLGPLTGRAFRIGHLGDCNPAMILGAIAGVEAALVRQGIDVGNGGTRRAVMRLAEKTQ